MPTAHTRTKFVTAAVGAVVATIAAPALLVLGAGIAHATPDVSARLPVGIIGDFPPHAGVMAATDSIPSQTTPAIPTSSRR